MKKHLKNENAITLLVLVLTIIVMLILAGTVTYNVLSQGGLLDKRKSVETSYNEEVNKTEQEIKKVDDTWGGVINKKGIEEEYGQR